MSNVLLLHTEVGTVVRFPSTGRIGAVMGWEGGALAIIRYAYGDENQVSGSTAVEVITTPKELATTHLMYYFNTDLKARG